MSAEPPQGLREALADALVAPLPEWTGGPDRFYWLARADASWQGRSRRCWPHRRRLGGSRS
jgi:hypothetical protein